jgi:ribosomal protein S6--L-glutamate ligase
MFSFGVGKIPFAGDSVTFENGAYVALGNRLKGLPQVITLGVKPNFLDYTPEERDLIFGAKIVLYPTDNYAQFFMTLGKAIFRALKHASIRMTRSSRQPFLMFWGSLIPRQFYSSAPWGCLERLGFPSSPRKPRASAQGRGVFKIENREQLEGTCSEFDRLYSGIYPA